jgi:hypothetical protein
VQRQRDDDDSMSLARPHQPFGKFKSSSSRGNEEKEERDTSNEKIQSAQYYLFKRRFVSVSLSLSLRLLLSNTDLFSFHSASQKLLRGTTAKAQRISHHAGKNFTLAIHDNNKYNNIGGERV